MKKRIALALVMVILLVAVAASCGRALPPDLTIATTTTVPSSNSIVVDLGLVMEVDETVVTNVEYSKLEDKDIGQVTFTYGGNNYVFRGSRTLSMSSLHEIATALDVNTPIVSNNVGVVEEMLFMTFIDGARVITWKQTVAGNEMNFTVYTEARVTDAVLTEIVSTAIKSNK